jgi:hypothetical protein
MASEFTIKLSFPDPIKIELLRFGVSITERNFSMFTTFQDCAARFARFLLFTVCTPIYGTKLYNDLRQIVDVIRQTLGF